MTQIPGEAQGPGASPDPLEFCKAFSVPAFWSNKFWIQAQGPGPTEAPVVVRISFGEHSLPDVPVTYRFAVSMDARQSIAMAHTILSVLAPALLVETSKAN